MFAIRGPISEVIVNFVSCKLDVVGAIIVHQINLSAVKTEGGERGERELISIRRPVRELVVLTCPAW